MTKCRFLYESLKRGARLRRAASTSGRRLPIPKRDRTSGRGLAQELTKSPRQAQELPPSRHRRYPVDGKMTDSLRLNMPLEANKKTAKKPNFLSPTGAAEPMLKRAFRVLLEQFRRIHGQWRKRACALCGVTVARASARHHSSFGSERALAARKLCSTCAQHCSMGLKSGE